MRSILLLLLTTAIVLSCEEKQNDILCTTEFVIISVEIKDQDLNPVILDDFTLTLVNENRDITDLAKTYQDEYMTEGHYFIASDVFPLEMEEGNSTIQFTRYKNSEK